MKINGNAVRPGNVIEHKAGLWVAVKIQHTQPGKGGAYLQVELKNLRDGTKLNERFRASESVERVRLEQKPHQFLFEDGELLTFMDTSNYEQVSISKDMVGERAAFLQDGMDVEIEFHEESPLTVILPEQVTLEITETEPTVKGQTAASSYKPAILENGIRVMVPPFCGTGEKIVVNTETSEYLKRAD
ncbi:elongation factor P [Sneathiella sp.]|uniref:elongation factor P n=1 Tax=Sneathiella sp. TaxID=1964365 RepID=UPI00260ABB85|nr:elongation factor P [Sneathiella sp.]MDF2368131.1 elongation factor P [Sneathiella sp.]